MTVKELFDKYCKKEGDEYICRGHYVSLDPASEEEIDAFKAMCGKFGVEQRVLDELVEYYSQSNSLFNYFVCNDLAMFDWWDGENQRSIWLGCLDDVSFIYDDIDHTYAIGEAGSKDLGEYATLMEMLEAFLKEGWENGWNE